MTMDFTLRYSGHNSRFTIDYTLLSTAPAGCNNVLLLSMLIKHIQHLGHNGP